MQEKFKQEEEAAYQRKLAAQEQERRDYELALRLAQDEMRPQQAIVENVNKPPSAAVQSQIAHSSLQRSTAAHRLTQEQEAARKKYNLTKWKFAELRDTINTSCDIDLLEACRDEFHRRLRVYHAWKARNKRTNQPGGAQAAQDQRAPQEIIQAAQASATNIGPPLPPRTSTISPKPTQASTAVRGGATVAAAATTEQAQRYFRVPFIRPSEHNHLNRQKGWWYAHFDGQWIARQLELHPDKEPLLLVAGKNDLEMCELSLDETGLSRKRGAEILEHEFEETWGKYGGKPYTRSAAKAKSETLL